MSADVPPPPLGFVGPWGAGGVKTQCIGQLPFLFFSALLNVVQYVGQGTDLRTFWYRTVKIGQDVSTGWGNKFEKI